MISLVVKSCTNNTLHKNIGGNVRDNNDWFSIKNPLIINRISISLFLSKTYQIKNS